MIRVLQGANNLFDVKPLSFTNSHMIGFTFYLIFSHYSIEEAKQKAEHDKLMKEAEEKKREVRQHIAKMRRMFKQLLEQNDTLPTHLRLHKDVSWGIGFSVYAQLTKIIFIP